MRLAMPFHIYAMHVVANVVGWLVGWMGSGCIVGERLDRFVAAWYIGSPSPVPHCVSK